MVYQADLLNYKVSRLSGNLSGDVTIVEFFDYLCGFCKQAAGGVTQLQTDDKNVRAFYRDFPILGELSVLTSKAALSAHRQGKHQVFHEALVAAHGELTREVLFAIAARGGLDTERLGADLQSDNFDSILDANRTLARKLGISGTPTFIINTT